MLRSALRRFCLRTVGLGLLLGPVSILAQESDRLRFGLGDAPFSLRADEVSYDPDRGVYEALGHVHIEQPDGDTLTADWVVFNALTNIGAASGNVVMRSGSDTIRAEFAAVDLDAFTALATEAVLDTAEPGFVVEGQPLQKTGTNTYHMEEAVFTTCRCAPGSGCRPWTIEAAEADIRVGGYAVARDVTFHVLDVPVLYTPWFLFPVKTERQSGFLIPRFFGDRRGGSVLEMPFFWAVRDELNVLLRPGWYSKRGIKTGVELDGEIALSFLRKKCTRK